MARRPGGGAGVVHPGRETGEGHQAALETSPKAEEGQPQGRPFRAQVRISLEISPFQVHPMGKKCIQAKWLSGEALQIAEKRREAQSKGEKERYKHLNAEQGAIRKPSSVISAKKSRKQQNGKD